MRGNICNFALYNQPDTPMTEQELNAYRLTSLEEPTDEMLEQIMREAAEKAAKETKAVREQYLQRVIASKKQTRPRPWLKQTNTSTTPSSLS